MLLTINLLIIIELIEVCVIHKLYYNGRSWQLFSMLEFKKAVAIYFATRSKETRAANINPRMIYKI